MLPYVAFFLWALGKHLNNYRVQKKVFDNRMLKKTLDKKKIIEWEKKVLGKGNVCLTRRNALGKQPNTRGSFRFQ